MKNKPVARWAAGMGLAAGGVLCVSGPGCFLPPLYGQAKSSAPAASYSISFTNYHGWKNSLVLRTDLAEAVVVPAIGRVMSFRLRDGDNVFWENEPLFGRTNAWEEASWRAREWVNYGGDKSWPAPEADWSKYTKRGWRPPPAFDGLAWEARIEGSVVVMTSPVDPFYGIRVTRKISLSSSSPTMGIVTTFDRVSGAPAKIGAWVITQLKEPVGILVPVPEGTKFTNGYALLAKEPPPSLKVEKGLISLTRNPKTAHKIGTEAGTLLWVGEKVMCRIDSRRLEDLEYPDQGSSAEVYTNPDPLRYVELETLGPLRTVKAGEKIVHINRSEERRVG